MLEINIYLNSADSMRAIMTTFMIYKIITDTTCGELAIEVCDRARLRDIQSPDVDYCQATRNMQKCIDDIYCPDQSFAGLGLAQQHTYTWFERYNACDNQVIFDPSPSTPSAPSPTSTPLPPTY